MKNHKDDTKMLYFMLEDYQDEYGLNQLFIAIINYLRGTKWEITDNKKENFMKHQIWA